MLRLEVDAGWREVALRYGAERYRPHGADQLAEALALGVSLRTYRRRLAEARDYLATRLKVSP
ncbi:hypothetical protein D3C80_2157790 [compost metagenome]